MDRRLDVGSHGGYSQEPALYLRAESHPPFSHSIPMTHPHVSHPRNADTPASPLPFSPSVCFGDLIFISGQASVDARGQIVSDTFEGEFRRSLENVRKVLEAAGSDLAHVIQTRNYVRDAADLPLYN